MTPATHQDALPPRAVAMMVLLCAVWALNQVAIKLGNDGFPPVLQTGLRSIGGALLLLAWCAWKRVPLLARDGTLSAGLLVGVIFTVEFMLLYEGMARTTAARGVVFLYTTPVFVALGAHLWLPGDRMTRAKAVGLAAAFAGLLLAFLDSLRLPSRMELTGDLLCLAAAVLWAATTLCIKGSALARARTEKTMLWQIGVSALLMPLGSLALGEDWRIAPGPLALGSLAFQIVIVTFLSYFAWFGLVRRYAASRLSGFTFLTPVFGVGFGAMLLGDPVTPAFGAALALVAAGIWLLNRPSAA